MDPSESFRSFVKEIEPRLRHALVAVLGQERGREAVAEALAFGWEQWDRVCGMDNPAGYLYRVGRTRASRKRGKLLFSPAPVGTTPDIEPGLPDALAELSEKQRVAVVMVHAYDWTRDEAAAVMGVSVSTLDTHLQRGLRKLRSELGVDSHV
jgi:RNA polymerase sigma-70 factor (ECF subfamily)